MLVPELNPIDEAVNQGFCIHDQKGTGDCGFRSIAASIAYADEGKILSEEQSRLQGAKLRAAAVTHMRRHKDTYLPFFAKDKDTAPNEPPPDVAKEFDNWLDDMSKPHTWINGLVLLALASKTGLPIVTWRKKGDSWFRATLAPKFKDGFAQGKTDAVPVILLLSDDHYRWLAPSAMKGNDIPTNWLRESALPPLNELQGSGRTKSAVSSDLNSEKTPSVHTLRVVKERFAPSVQASVRCKQKQSQPQTPFCATPSVHSLKQVKAARCRSALKSLEPSQSQTAASLGDSLEGSTEGVSQVDDNQNFVGIQNKRTPADRWTCPYCSRVFHKHEQRTPLNQRRRDHLNKVHPKEKGSKFDHMREYTPLVMATKNLHPSAVVWECPFCECCLPALPKWEHDKSVAHHYKVHHPRRDTSRKAILAARAKLLKTKRKTKQKAERSLQCRHRNLKRAAATRDMCPDGHELAHLEVNSLDWPTVRSKNGATFCSFFTCTKCRGVRRSGHFKTKCPGLRAQPHAAQRALWKRLKKDQTTALASAWGLTLKDANAWYSPCPAPSAITLAKKVSKHSVNQTWQRNLVEEGIEPNPGPSHWSALSLNCGSRDNTWSFANMLCDKKITPDVACLQETFLNPETRQTMAHKLGRSGYRLWTTEPKQSGDQFRGGVAVAVKSTLRARLVSTFSSKAGQAVAVHLDTVIIASVWKGHEAIQETDDFLACLGEWRLQSLAQGIPLVFLGDWNWTPQENPLLHDDTFTYVAAEIEGEFPPTRWKGRRTIDYALLSSGLRGEASFLQEAFGDHIGIKFQFQSTLVNGNTYARVPTRRFHQPEHLTRQQWKAALADAWVNDGTPVPAEGLQDVEAEWAWFNAKLEKVFRQVGGNTHSGFCRNKGTAPQLVPSHDTRVGGYKHGSYKERGLRKLLGRIREANRQHLTKGTCGPELVKKITNRWPSNLVWTSWQEAEQLVEKELSMVAAASKTERINVWKRLMNEQGKAASRWMQGANAQPIPELLFPDGSATSSAEEGFQQLSKFWSTIWHRNVTIPRLQDLHQQIDTQQWRLPFPMEDWVPTVEDFTAAAQRNAGSAAGCDGWTGAEMAAMPTEVFDTFLALVRRWSAKGTWPKVWNDIRQVHLRKNPGFGPVYAKDLRPIAVLSIWYRSLISALTRNPLLQTWLLGVAPRACHGGLKGRSVTTAVASLLPHLEQGAAALALDYQKCFDMLHPELVVAHLRLHQWPETLLSLLRQIWGNQNRWMELGHLSAGGAQTVSSSMLQGDPLSPLGLVVVLAEATASVSHAGHIQSVFLDDRLLVAPTIKSLLRAWRHWQSWSHQLGLVENDSKVVGF